MWKAIGFHLPVTSARLPLNSAIAGQTLSPTWPKISAPLFCQEAEAAKYINENKRFKSLAVHILGKSFLSLKKVWTQIFFSHIFYCFSKSGHLCVILPLLMMQHLLQYTGCIHMQLWMPPDLIRTRPCPPEKRCLFSVDGRPILELSGCL